MKREQTKGVKTLLGNPKKAIINLAIPTAFASFGQILLNLTDSIYIAGLGVDALAAAGFVFPIFFILMTYSHGPIILLSD